KSKALQQPLDIVELELRATALAEALAQFFQNAARTLGIDLARHLHGDVVAIFVAAQRTAERIGVLLRALLAAAGPAIGAGAHALLLHLLRQTLRALAHRLQRATLAVDRAFGIAVAQLAFGLAHGPAGVAEFARLLALAVFA